MKSLRRCESGAALVEFRGSLAPVLSFLLIGIVDFGRFMYDGILAANAARAGVQYGAQTLITAKDTSGQQTAATNDAAGLSGLTATASQPWCEINGSATTCGTANSVAFVKVTVTGSFSPLIGLSRPPPLTSPVSGSATMRVEQQ